jgi:hypothetical protein
VTIQTDFGGFWGNPKLRHLWPRIDFENCSELITVFLTNPLEAHMLSDHGNPLVRRQLTELIWATFSSSENPALCKGIAESFFTNPEHETAHKSFQGFGRYVGSLDTVAKTKLAHVPMIFSVPERRMYAQQVHQTQHRWWINAYQCPAKSLGGFIKRLTLGPYLRVCHNDNPATLSVSLLNMISVLKVVHNRQMALN